jgi:hypothetical protein
MFGKGRIFRVPKHQQFKYKPMYYDPQKEELQDRLNALKELQKNDIEGTKARIASGIKSGHLQDQAYRQDQIKRSNIKLVMIVVMLVVLGYLLLNVYLPELNAFME